MNKRILLIDHHDSFTYNLRQLIEECHTIPVDVLSYRLVRRQGLEEYAGFVLSPGPQTPADYEYLKWFLPWVAGRKPLLGVCLGHQAIGTYFGARLVNLKKVFHGVTTEVRIVDPYAYLFRGCPCVLQVGLYHSWALDPNTISRELVVSAVSREGVIMAIHHREWPISGVQFHPESVMTPFGAHLMHNWLKNVAEKEAT